MKLIIVIFLSIVFLFGDKIEIITLKKEPLKNIFSLIPDIETNNTKVKKNKVLKLKMPFYASLSLDLLKTDKEDLNYLIKKYNNRLPFRDKLEALIRLKRINEAKKVAFENLKKSNDYRTYKQDRDFYMNYANRIKLENNYVTSKSISYLKNKTGIKYYLFKGYYGYFYNENYFTNKYSNINIFKLGIKRLLNKGYNYYEIGGKNNKGLFLFKNNYPSRKIESDFFIGRDKADESDYLLFNATKTFIKEHILYSFTNKNVLEASLSFNRYNDKKYLGNSYILNLKYIKKLRVTYPNFAYYVFSNFNHFSKNKKLPLSSKEVGIGYFFGLDQKEIYHHKITPFLDTSLVYNSKFGSNINFLIGASGRIYRHDNLSFGINYSKSISGNNNFEYKLNYIYWF